MTDKSYVFFVEKGKTIEVYVDSRSNIFVDSKNTGLQLNIDDSITGNGVFITKTPGVSTIEAIKSALEKQKII